MHTADSLLRDGDLGGARAELVDMVRKTPGNVEARMFLFQLLALTGEWAKARAQLTALAQLSPEAQMFSVAYGQAIDAELARADAFAGAAPVSLLVKSQPWTEDLVTALTHEIAGRFDEADNLRGKAYDAAPDMPGTVDGVDFDWIADADHRFGPALEAIIAGKWGLLPLDAVDKITCEGPKDLRDLMWLPVQIAFRSGSSVAGFLPARYPGTESSGDNAAILGRITSEAETPLGSVLTGQRLLALSTGDDRGLLALRSLVMTGGVAE